ncbi:MAG: hypothetical protein SGARI_001356 [Bacillariaceae sp.]
MGGFLDADGTSSQITNWLLRLLADIAHELEQSRRCTLVLKTCAVTSLNDDNCQSPMGRGMGINVHTGQVFLAKCAPEIAVTAATTSDDD